MKKYFLQSTLGLLLFASTAAQNPGTTAPCAANWWAKCCICASCLVVEKLPKFGHCRHCNLLCPNCREKLGNLDSALAKLKAENRMLMDKLKAYQRSANEHNAKLTDALVKTYGQESGHWTFNDPSSWRNLTMSGFNSSIGKFYGAYGSVAANFTSLGLPVKIGANVISILQTENAWDAATNLNGTVFDILTSDGIRKGFENEMILNAGQKFGEELKRARTLKGAAFQQAFFRAKNNFIREARFVDNFSKAANKADFGNTLLDIYNLIQAGAELLSNLYDIYDNYRIREAALKERLETQNKIVDNVKKIACIKETKDSLDSGGLGKISRGRSFFDFSLVTINLSDMSQEDVFYSLLTDNKDIFNSGDETYWEVDTIKIKSAMSQLKSQQAILNEMIKVISNDVVPPLIPWIIQRQDELNAETRTFLLKSIKKPLDVLMSLYKRAGQLSETLGDNLSSAITGQEIFYITDVSGKRNSENNTLRIKEKWSHISNNKIKGELGRVNMSFPADADWSIDFYTSQNKFVTNRSKSGKKYFEDLAPGIYNLKLNTIPIQNVSIEKGKETLLNVGYLDVISPGHWDIYNESREKFYTSGNKPVKLALPVGIYVLNFEGKDYSIMIREKTTVKFELSLPFLD